MPDPITPEPTAPAPAPAAVPTTPPPAPPAPPPAPAEPPKAQPPKEEKPQHPPPPEKPKPATIVEEALKAKGEEKKTDQKGKDPEKPEGGEPKGQEPAPEIEISLPKDVQVDAALLDQFKPLAKSLGLKSEHAQQLVDLYADAQKRAIAEGQGRLLKERFEEWPAQIRTDKEIGNAKFDESVVLAGKAALQFFDEPTREFLNDSGLFNHPGLFRGLVRAGRALAEDTIAGTGAQPPGESEEARLRKMYPSMFPKE